MKDKAIIVDLDGTLCNHSARLPHLLNKDWDKYYSDIIKDPVNEKVRQVINNAYITGIRVLILTARECRDHIPIHTEYWLKNNVIKFDRIYFRALGDYRPDYVVKAEIYNNVIKQQYDVIAVYDDKAMVRAFFVKEGIECPIF